MSKQGRRQLKLGAFLMAPGHHVAAWRHPGAQADLGRDFAAYARIAQEAEAARFDAVFLADTLSAGDTSASASSRTARVSYFEPLTLLSGLAAVTRRIGLIATVSTSFNEPFNVARKFASLDLISQGRAGWNLVTSNHQSEADNFGSGRHLSHDLRYERAEEFVDVVLKLWHSWAPEAFLYDKSEGRYYDRAKLRDTRHAGRHFQVQGPLHVAPSAQGHPVIVQAGSSGPGIELAARTAEVVFTAQRTLDEAQVFYRTLKSRVQAYGRDPDDLKIMPGIFPVIGASRAEAQEKFDALQDLIHPEVAVHLLSDMIGFDLTGYPVDGPLPPLPVSNGGQSRQQLLLALARDENLSILQLARKIAGARGHWQLVGTAKDVADELEAYFQGGGADGFNIMPPTLPGGLTEFIAGVLPELRRRGLFREEYEGDTLRANLGLRVPAGAETEARSRVAA